MHKRFVPILFLVVLAVITVEILVPTEGEAAQTTASPLHSPTPTTISPLAAPEPTRAPTLVPHKPKPKRKLFG